jgi:hypothetical protein
MSRQSAVGPAERRASSMMGRRRFFNEVMEGMEGMQAELAATKRRRKALLKFQI